MKKIASILILVLTLTTIFSSSILAVSDFDVPVESAILIEAETGEVLFEKNADKVVPPASITKIMTLLLAMEAIDNGQLSLEDEITISKKAESMGGSQIFLPDGISLKLEELLEAVAMASANDASVAVAEAVGGSYGNFIHMMNQKRKELGMDNTNFVNSTGLPAENHYSTARDISIMARELVKHKKVLDWSSKWLDYIELPERNAMVVNTNKLINKYDGLDGLKTGHTQEAGFCLAGTAKNNEMRLISVVLDAETDTEREKVTTDLLDYGFNNFIKNEIVVSDEVIENIQIPNGKKTVTTAKTAKDYSTVVKIGQGDSYDVKTKLKNDIKAPLNEGDILGQKVIYEDEKEIASVNIIATENIEKANIFTRFLRSVKNWFSNLFS